MADITRATLLPSMALIPFGVSIRNELDVGLSTGGYGFIIHNPANEALANQIADGVDTLTVASDKVSIASDNIEEATITCVELPTVFDYRIYQDDTFILDGSVLDGSIEFRTNDPGNYVFEINAQGTYNTGYIQVEAI